MIVSGITATDLRQYSRILFYAMIGLILAPVIGSMGSQEVAGRVHEIQAVIIAGFGAMGTLLGWIKTIEQWGLTPKAETPPK
jgi:FtsH-binding integral membrane protein